MGRIPVGEYGGRYDGRFTIDGAQRVPVPRRSYIDFIL